jgi:hypothetical protein
LVLKGKRYIIPVLKQTYIAVGQGSIDTRMRHGLGAQKTLRLSSSL